jgi:UDP-2,3-diacylglucosamine pyrophosphatase LpxH
MKIKIISDLHLGVKGAPSNNFVLDEDLFTHYLEATLAEYDQLILAGDTFELWEEFIDTIPAPPKTMTMTANLSILKDRITERFQSIVKSWSFMPLLLNHEKVIFINGNHDAMIRTIPLITNKEVLQSRLIETIGLRIYVAHGHQGDFYNRDSSPCRWIACCCQETVGTLDDLIDPQLDHDISRLAQATVSNTKDVTQYAFQLTQRLPCDVVIFGHTHEAGLWEHNHKVYLNSGCLVRKKEAFDEIVIISDEVKRSIHLESHQYQLASGTILNPLMVNLSGQS